MSFKVREFSMSTSIVEPSKQSNPSFPSAKYSLVATVYTFSASIFFDPMYTLLMSTLYPGSLVGLKEKCKLLVCKNLPSRAGHLLTETSQAFLRASPVQEISKIGTTNGIRSSQSISFMFPCGKGLSALMLPELRIAQSELWWNLIRSHKKLPKGFSSVLTLEKAVSISASR